jgi:alanine racemase
MTTPSAGRPTLAAIDAAALRHNFALLRAAVAPDVAVLAVVKGDGYGHDAALVAPVLAAAGADWFGVATVDEGVALRCAGVRQPILVLTGAVRAEVGALAEYDLAVAVPHADMGRDLAAGAPVRPLRVHVKVDTGMGRIGVLPHELPALLAELRGSGAFSVEGLFSHFASAEGVDHGYAQQQLEAFGRAYDGVRAAGGAPRWVHIANSAATLRHPDAHFSLVRPGIALYGVEPAGTPAPGLRPVMRLATHIVQLKSVPPGFAVSYGQTFVSRRPSLIATLPIGYADGYGRALSNRGCVLVRGQRAPVVGAVCMDLTMVDVTEVAGVRLGDEVVLWGRQYGAEITAGEVADWQGSIAYEVLTRLGPRVPRVLEREG